jgi:hypothetical protein
MKIALIRRGHITQLDGVNRFIALLAEGLKRLGHEVEVFSWCYRSVEEAIRNVGLGWKSFYKYAPLIYLDESDLLIKN